ncbi:chromosome segregation protein SMC, partial [archaeon]|nr:chromosome segregation protein SMC [archaeon]
MVHVKKLIIQGFKSFPKKTELPFTPGINVILGPNGSGKSNLSDALCFVLGRLSIKSMRAAKASNLIFLGTKAAAPSKEASVEIIFDNQDQSFGTGESEVSIKRIVRRTGQSLYKINGHTKTRQDILGLLAQAGIDPNGFNIILQGEIQNFVRMQGEERRKVIEEVSGISIYEMRKEKSLKELDKTDGKLKEVMAILRERTSYLNNLEKERQEALRYQKLEQDLKKFKASIIYHDLERRKRVKKEVEERIVKKNKEIEKSQKVILANKSQIENFEEKIKSINLTIQQSTGLEQEKLNNEIANLRADLAGLRVRQDNYDRKLNQIEKQRAELQTSLRNNQVSIKELQKESPTIEKNQKQLSLKKQELELIEEKRKKHYMTKSELRTIRDRLDDKKSLLQNYETESEFLLKQMNSLGLELFDKKTSERSVEDLKFSLMEKKEFLDKLNRREIDLEKLTNRNEFEISEQSKLLEKIAKIDVCPVCKSKITEEHLCSIKDESAPKMQNLTIQVEKSDKELNELYSQRDLLKSSIESITEEISKRQGDLVKMSNIEDRKEQIKNLHERIQITKSEVIELDNLKKKLEEHSDDNSTIDEKYETLKIELQDISLRNKESLDSELSFKQREIERMENTVKQLNSEEKELQEEAISVKKVITQKETHLNRKRKDEEKLTQKFQKFISERDGIQMKIRTTENELSKTRNITYNLEQEVNNFKIDIARINAEITNFETEILEFPNVEFVRTNNRSNLTEKLVRIQDSLSRIGSVNMRALEVYDSVKEEYDKINEKVETISSEKEGIMKIIHQIDIKKKKAFLSTLNSLNSIFSRNFMQISTKGEVTLELENKKDPFDGGVSIIVKTGHGKYFDVKSLSGGEQTMVALSLIFAIQELKPYAFYILDEIDAALDKRNSERLAGLLRKYMQQGQYLVITHNDEIITNATNLFGVSMHDG